MILAQRLQKKKNETCEVKFPLNQFKFRIEKYATVSLTQVLAEVRQRALFWSVSQPQGCSEPYSAQPSL